jgi:hypothetical protein
MTTVVVTVSKSSSLPLIILNNGFAASLTASGNAAAIITGRRSLPIRFTGRCV